MPDGTLRENLDEDILVDITPESKQKIKILQPESISRQENLTLPPQEVVDVSREFGIKISDLLAAKKRRPDLSFRQIARFMKPAEIRPLSKFKQSTLPLRRFIAGTPEERLALLGERLDKAGVIEIPNTGLKVDLLGFISGLKRIKGSAEAARELLRKSPLKGLKFGIEELTERKSSAIPRELLSKEQIKGEEALIEEIKKIAELQKKRFPLAKVSKTAKKEFINKVRRIGERFKKIEHTTEPVGQRVIQVGPIVETSSKEIKGLLPFFEKAAVAKNAKEVGGLLSKGKSILTISLLSGSFVTVLDQLIGENDDPGIERNLQMFALGALAGGAAGLGGVTLIKSFQLLKQSPRVFTFLKNAVKNPTVVASVASIFGAEAINKVKNLFSEAEKPQAEASTLEKVTDEQAKKTPDLTNNLRRDVMNDKSRNPDEKVGDFLNRHLTNTGLIDINDFKRQRLAAIQAERERILAMGDPFQEPISNFTTKQLIGLILISLAGGGQLATRLILADMEQKRRQKQLQLQRLSQLGTEEARLLTQLSGQQQRQGQEALRLQKAAAKANIRAEINRLKRQLKDLTLPEDQKENLENQLFTFEKSLAEIERAPTAADVRATELSLFGNIKRAQQQALVEFIKTFQQENPNQPVPESIRKQLHSLNKDLRNINEELKLLGV